jgi:RHS repeat-associated protein
MREGTGAGTVGLKWLLRDHLGSTSISAQGSDGAKQSELRYKPFGELRYAWGTTTTSLRYTGQRAEGTGLYDYGARFMDPLLGRFIQPDPIVPGTGEGGNSNAVGSLGASTYSPLTVDYHEHQFLEHLNSDNKASLQDTNFRLPPVPTNSIAFDRYAYSLNNPIRYVDPSGHFAILGVLPFIPVWGWVALGAVALAGVVYYAAGGPEALANGIYQAGEAASNSVNVLLAESANDQTDTTKPGPYAGESIDARGPDRDFTDEEREAIDAIGRATGCHTCGSKSPRTKSGHFIPDHQPPSALNPSGSPQRLYPHCLSCSRRQGGQTRDVLRR